VRVHGGHGNEELLGDVAVGFARAIEPATQPSGGHDQPESAVDTGTVSIVSMIEMVSRYGD
jgi:hypothetical protein